MLDNSITIISKKDLVTYNIIFKCGFLKILETNYYPKIINNTQYDIVFDDSLINALNSACIEQGNSYCYYEKELGELKRTNLWKMDNCIRELSIMYTKDIDFLHFISYEFSDIINETIFGTLKIYNKNPNVLYEIKNIKETEANAIMTFWKENKNGE